MEDVFVLAITHQEKEESIIQKTDFYLFQDNLSSIKMSHSVANQFVTPDH